MLITLDCVFSKCSISNYYFTKKCDVESPYFLVSMDPPLLLISDPEGENLL